MIVPATDQDFLAFYGESPPEVWLGMAYKEQDRVLGMGTVIWNEHGCALGFVDRRRPVSAFAMHRAVLKVFAALKAAGEPAVYVMCDRRFPKAEYWLRRLGFIPTDDNPDLWRVTL
jgi:hypothetical protein